jgi:hypothetical protein
MAARTCTMVPKAVELRGNPSLLERYIVFLGQPKRPTDFAASFRIGRACNGQPENVSPRFPTHPGPKGALSVIHCPVAYSGNDSRLQCFQGKNGAAGQD